MNMHDPAIYCSCQLFYFLLLVKKVQETFKLIMLAIFTLDELKTLKIFDMNSLPLQCLFLFFVL